MRRRVIRITALVALAALLGLDAGCGYDAYTDACYALIDTYGARLAECGYYPSMEEASRALHDQLAADGFNCDMSPVGVRDENQLYDECLPQLMELECSMANMLPEPCQEQIIYRE